MPTRSPRNCPLRRHVLGWVVSTELTGLLRLVFLYVSSAIFKVLKNVVIIFHDTVW